MRRKTHRHRRTLGRARYHSPVPRAARSAIVAACIPIAFVAACRGTPAAFGPTQAAARVNADDVFTALANRFTRVERGPKLSGAIAKMAHAALSPSRIYDDMAVWTDTTPAGARELLTAGTFAGDHYVFTPQPVVPPPSRLGDGRHDIQLVRLAPGQYEWTTDVLSAVGSLTGDDLARVTTSMLAAAATQSEADIRSGAISTFPRTAAVLAQLYSFDSLQRTPLDDGSANLRLVFGVHPDRLKATKPHFAAFVDKYVGRSRIHCVLLERDTTRWFDFEVDHDRMTFALNTTKNGHFAPSSGGTRPMPDSLMLRSDVHTKSWIFGVGLSNLLASFTVVHDPHDHGWLLRWRKEPDWHFPLLVEHLIKAPLRRPFEGDGVMFRVSVRDSAGAQSILKRDARVAIQESGIATWLGGLGSNAMGALAGQTDIEMNAYLAELFSALKADIDQQ